MFGSAKPTKCVTSVPKFFYSLTVWEQNIDSSKSILAKIYYFEIQRSSMETIKVQAQALSESDKKFLDAIDDDIINQGTLLDGIGKQLITLELAISGIYATVLKLTSTVTIHLSFALFITFLFWFISLVFAFVAIFPKRYRVNIAILDEVKGFFEKSATHKRRFLIFSSISFFAGIIASVFIVI